MKKWLLIGGCLIVIVIAAGVWFGPQFAALLVHQTTGSIFVSGPQVYTRERLVNDRYREDAWLASLLETEKDEKFGASAVVSQLSERTGSANVVLSGGLASSGGQAAPTAQVSNQSPVETPNGIAPLDLSPFQRFEARRTYREQIRTLLIENQLDDRHDLRGNSLYRLRFDAAVVPGDNTGSNAVIEVSVLPPYGLLSGTVTGAEDNEALRKEEQKLATLTTVSQLDNQERQVWERVYLRWLDSLEKRFEDARQTLRAAYFADRFGSDDYETLLARARQEAVRQREKVLRPLFPFREMAKKAQPDAFANPGRFLSDTPPSEADVTLRDRNPALANAHDALRNGTPQDIAHAHAVYKGAIEDIIQMIRAEDEAAHVLASGLPNLGGVAQNPSPPPLNPSPLSDVCGGLSAYGSVLSLGTVESRYDLSYFMDAAFKDKLAKSILGLPTHPEIGDAQNSIKDLVPLALEETSFGSDGPAYLFKERTVPLVYSPRADCFPTALKDDVESRQVSADRTVYILKSQMAQLRALIPDLDINKELAEQVKSWTLPGHPRADTDFVRAGLINFIRAAGRRLDAFSYAFTPSEPDEIYATSILDRQNRSLTAQGNATIIGTAAHGAAEIEQRSSRGESRNANHKPIVAFGDHLNSSVATFGWIIRPHEEVRGTDRYRQEASQISLTALVSLPAWWEEIRVKIVRNWKTSAGDLIASKQQRDEEYTIELPVNFETVDAALFETNNRGPVINEWASDQIVVRSCNAADIVIPGRRLWRSTVVMLGGQKADEIFVLPDMNGIVAKFKEVGTPTGSESAAETTLPLTVWTSQGSTALPLRVRVLPASGTPDSACSGARAITRAPDKNMTAANAGASQTPK